MQKRHPYLFPFRNKKEKQHHCIIQQTKQLSNVLRSSAILEVLQDQIKWKSWPNKTTKIISDLFQHKTQKISKYRTH